MPIPNPFVVAVVGTVVTVSYEEVTEIAGRVVEVSGNGPTDIVPTSTISLFLDGKYIALLHRDFCIIINFFPARK